MPKKKEKKQNRAKKAEESIPNLLSIGELDLIFKIEFKKEDLEKSESKSSEDGKTEYYELEDLNELKDLSFLQENEDLWDKFQLKGGNETINSLLIGNKNNKKKCQIEYICFGLPQFEGEEEFFEEIFEHVTTKNGLNINKTPLKEGARYSLKIEMKSEKEVKIIEIGKTEEEEKKEKDENDKEEKDEEEEKKKKEGDQNGNEMGEEEEEEDEDYEENDAMLDKRIPKFKRSKSVLCNLDPSSTKYEMVYLNYEDFSKIPGDFKMEDMIEFLTFLKKKNSTIFINFYKKEISSQPQQEEKVKQDNKNEKNKKEEQNDKKGEENKEEKAGDNKDEKDKKEEKNEENKKEEETKKRKIKKKKIKRIKRMIKKFNQKKMIDYKILKIKQKIKNLKIKAKPKNYNY